VEGFKWSLLQRPFPGTELLVTALITAVLLVTGQAYFRNVERTFADVI
jgi:ABC-type polysaccharide/polyol phosphate export permease